MAAAGAEYVDRLDAEYDPDSGFIGMLRVGRRFDQAACDHLLGILDEIRLPSAEALDARFVSLLWWMNQTVEWQAERVGESGGDAAAVRTAADKVLGHVSRILGVP